MLLFNGCLILLLFISLSTQSGNFWLCPCISRMHCWCVGNANQQKARHSLNLIWARLGCAVPQTASFRIVTVEAQVHSQGGSYGTWGKQSGTGARVPPSSLLRFSPSTFHSTIVIRGWLNLSRLLSLMHSISNEGCKMAVNTVGKQVRSKPDCGCSLSFHGCMEQLQEHSGIMP